jgi:hypothetical protein
MPSRGHEDSIRLRIGILEAQGVRSSNDSGYPYPPLRPTDQVETREFACIILENSYLRATIVPDLGGRLLRLFDKRTSEELLDVPDVLLCQAGGPRGARLPSGIQLSLDGQERLNSLGSVYSQLETSANDSEAAVWLGEFAPGLGLAWHLRISLPADSATLRFEARVSNRSLQEQPYNAGFLGIPAAWGRQSDRKGLETTGTRFTEVKTLQGRQVDNWRLDLAPFSPHAQVSSADAAAWIGESLMVQVARPLPAAKVFFLSADQQTLEATFDFYPEHVMDIPLGGHAPVALLIQGADGRELLRWPANPQDAGQVGSHLEFVAGTRHLAHTEFAIEHLAQGRYAEADFEFEQALLYNGDDPLLWWAKAVTQRLMGVTGERDELANAHYLAPLDPVLRAEAFLSQSSEQGREPNPLLRNVSPEDLVDVACLLIEHRLLSEASRWIDEALRHEDLAMLHYLYADALIQGTRMDTEAAQHVVKAESAQLPPYPWREVEWAALRRLATRFPDQPRLSELLSL